MSKWAPEELATIRRCVADKWTAAQIAKILPGRTRNAVVGKVNRMHGISLAGRGNPVGRKPKPKTIRPVKPVFKPIPLYTKGDALAYDETALRLDLMDLTDKTCRWPAFGEGEHTLFCGHETETGSSYCPHHTMRGRSAPVERDGERAA